MDSSKNDFLKNIAVNNSKTTLKDKIVIDIYAEAEKITDKNIHKKSDEKFNWEDRIDNILTSKLLGFPIMLIILAAVFWLTIIGANYPSSLLAEGLFWLEKHISSLFLSLNTPLWFHDLLVLGMFRTIAWVVSVMLPPMAIFFPIFTLLEDLGYLPRIAFNLDNYFKKSGAHGKQALSMSMGFGCNAAGVIAARIIESPREKLIAILTNTFVPCNGRFPTLIILSSLFMGTILGGKFSSFIATAVVIFIVIIGIIVTFFVSWLLSRTLLKGIPSSFTLELPPYRKPQVGKVLLHSFVDRTLFVLGRALIIAAPAGIVVWICANINIHGENLITLFANFLDPLAILIGLDGFILLAFILGLPANEIVLPILVMSYLSAETMLEPGSNQILYTILINNGWTWVTALSTMFFSLLHFPCGTTLLTIKKETNSIKWTLFAAFMPLSIAFLVNFLLVQIINIFM